MRIGALFTAFLLSKGPQDVQFGFFRAPMRRVGAVPHILPLLMSIRGAEEKIN
jgi:hypothetical protein